MKKFKFYLNFICLLLIIILFIFSQPVLAAYPKLITTLSDAFEAVEKWLIKISTPAAAVAVRDWSFYEEI